MGPTLIFTTTDFSDLNSRSVLHDLEDQNPLFFLNAA